MNELRVGILWCCLSTFFVLAMGCGGQQMVSPPMDELERMFSESMTDVALVGQFTIFGREDSARRPERYEIESIEKVGDNEWQFNARVQYGKVDVTLPIRVPVFWAGDTPVVSMTDFSIPTLGTFTARVFFYREKYMGTWQHGQSGGYMFGTIEKMVGQ